MEALFLEPCCGWPAAVEDKLLLGMGSNATAAVAAAYHVPLLTCRSEEGCLWSPKSLQAGLQAPSAGHSRRCPSHKRVIWLAVALAAAGAISAVSRSHHEHQDNRRLIGQYLRCLVRGA